MSTTEDDLLAQVNARRAHLRVTQKVLASACGLDQGHLSKVLAGKVKLAPKTERLLRGWLAASQNGSAVNEEEIRRLVERISKAPAERQMEIMQLLRIVERLAR